MGARQEAEQFIPFLRHREGENVNAEGIVGAVSGVGCWACVEIGPSGQGRSRSTASATTAHRQKRPAAGTCQPKVSGSIGFRPGQAEPKTFSGELSDFPTTTLCAQLWFEGAGGRPPAATAPPSEATWPEGGEPRLWGSVAAHARVEPPEQVVACASDHAHLGHGKGAAAQLEGDAVGVERRSRAPALCSFCTLVEPS